MRTNDLPRLAAIMRKTHEWGWGLKRLVPLLEDASRVNRMHFSADERRLAILLYWLAGAAGLNALSADKLLPSVYHSLLAGSPRLHTCLSLHFYRGPR